MKKKSSFTLIETLIGSFLALLILSFIGFIFKQTAETDRIIKKKEKESFEISFASFRLNTFLSKILPVTNQQFYFFEGPSNLFFKENTDNLIFSFNNGIQLNKPFSNQVLARLFVSKENNLTLLFWPLPKDKKESLPKAHQEILLEGVDNLQISFFVPRETTFTPLGQSKEMMLKPLLKEVPRNQWVKEWPSRFKQPPALLKIEITKNNKVISLIIPTLTILHPIIYGFEAQ